MVYLPAIIVFGALLAVVIVIVARGGSLLWRWLFAIEVLVLFECFGNCFVPGLWKQFWQIEIPAVIVACALALGSSVARMRKEHLDKAAIWKMPQMLALYVVVVIVAIMIASH
jgi:hypothetical protein